MSKMCVHMSIYIKIDKSKTSLYVVNREDASINVHEKYI